MIVVQQNWIVFGNVSIYDVVILSHILFFVGAFGVVVMRNNVIIIIMAIELMFLSANINFVSFSVSIDDIAGQIFALFVLAITAAESAIGLAVVISYYRLRGVISVDYINCLKG